MPGGNPVLAVTDNESRDLPGVRLPDPGAAAAGPRAPSPLVLCPLQVGRVVAAGPAAGAGAADQLAAQTCPAAEMISSRGPEPGRG